MRYQSSQQKFSKRKQEYLQVQLTENKLTDNKIGKKSSKTDFQANKTSGTKAKDQFLSTVSTAKNIQTG